MLIAWLRDIDAASKRNERRRAGTNFSLPRCTAIRSLKCTDGINHSARWS